jgi:DivIVA domain-containing protein
MSSTSPSPTPGALQGTLRPDDVVNAHFSATTFRPGYDERSVDDFFDRVVADLRARWAVVDAGPTQATRTARPRFALDAERVAKQTFGNTKFRQGYVQRDVDRLVQEVASTMARLDSYLRTFRFAGDASS